VQRFVNKHQARITGVISCFDRILFKGHLPLGWPGAMEGFISRQGLRIKDFGHFVCQQSERIKQHARVMAQRTKRPYIHLNSPCRKENVAQSICRKDAVTEGLVCILAAVETCHSFKLAHGDGRPRLVFARRKCLCLYFYFVDREFGLLHVRITSWFPFMIQVCLNGHDWLARKMERHGIGYRQLDNAFLSIDDPARAQRLADAFVRKNWPRVLSAFARRVNPLMKDLLSGMDYYWVTQQAEYATDIMFKNPAALAGLYDRLLKHATCCLSAEDVMTFLGRKLHPSFAGEIGNDCQRRWPGARVRHRMKENGIKMYDKHGCVLRVETTINRPSEFKVRRRGVRNGQRVTAWFPMAKGVANLYRYAEISRGANRRYLDALAVVHDPTAAHEQIHALALPVRRQGRCYRGFNPACPDDIRLFAAVLRGEHLIGGFTNRDIRAHLLVQSRDSDESRRHAARISRLLKRLHMHGLIAKIPRSRRWRTTHNGHALLATAVMLHDQHYPDALISQAA
jgi:CBS domain-containing protein